MRWACLALALLAQPALAQHQVYDPEPPRGSAYVRFINALPGEVEIRPDFLPLQRLGVEPSQRVGAYMVVENVAGRALNVDARVRGQTERTTLRVQPDSFVTVLISAALDGATRVSSLPEEMNFNRARVRLGFYNGVAACTSAGLRIDPDGPPVFESVGAAAGRQRTVNAVRAAVRGTCGERFSPAFQLEGLEAGASFSVVLTASADGALQSFLVRDVTTPWRR